MEVPVFLRLIRALAFGLPLVVIFARGANAQQLPQVAPADAATTAPKQGPPPAFPLPSSTSTPGPGRLLVSGHVRAYDFQRVNHVQNATNLNRHSFAIGVIPHLDYRIGDTPLNIGYTYGGSTGFGLNGPNPIKNGKVDNTLPGYPVNQPISELYVQYKAKGMQVTVGDQYLNYSWLPTSDSRVEQSSYQGTDSRFALTPALTASLSRVIRFEPRNASNFSNNTLLTAAYPQNSNVTTTGTSGALRVGLEFRPSTRLVVLAEDNEFYDIANLVYAEGRYGLDPYSTLNPFVAVQYVAENTLGAGKVGRVDDHMIGAQVGAYVAKGLQFTAAGDFAPWKYRYVKALTVAGAGKGTFLPGGGSGTAEAIGGGVYKVAYGGIASPYSDTYASDPIYTTSITQGMVERRSAGESYKAALTFTSPNKQFKLIGSEAWYDYSNDVAHNLTSELNLDGTYYFNKVRKGAYKGFFVRVRVAPRTQPTIPYNFQYQRFQTEYDF